jgi:malate dehydrogenase (oxaloacetate-decarboxylating)(NADP+)
LNKTPKLQACGVDLLHDPALNKGTAFTEEEREALGLRGLLPPRVQTPARQIARVLEGVRNRSNDLQRYEFLIGLQDRNETLFYRLLVDHIEEIMPLIYTPTVGQACQRYGHIFRRSHGIYISVNDRGRVAQLLNNWPRREARAIVVTDGERILGLGDLGANGMGIPVGKLSLYAACAGIHPALCLPVTIDAGTDNAALLEDPLYLGVPHPRVRGEVYDGLIDEFVDAVRGIFPDAFIQFEDFARDNAFRLLTKYREQVCCFNDDIQGTGAVVLAGLRAALKITSGSFTQQRLLFFGAGEAGTGIADLIVKALIQQGLGEREARSRCWFIDSKGLVVKGRSDLHEQKRLFAHEHEFVQDSLAAVQRLRPTVLIGVCGKRGVFSRSILEAMATNNLRPIVFALSNPTALTECTAEDAYRWTQGRAIFAGGSPFARCVIDGRTFAPGQGNNAYIFPGVGLGLLTCRARSVTDDMFLAAATALAKEVSQADLEAGRVYPRLTRIREVSLSIAEAVIQVARRQGLARAASPTASRSALEELIYQPEYRSYV